MIIRMCGRCQEEIDKERQKVASLEKELEELKDKIKKSAMVMVECNCGYIGDLTFCPYCSKK